MLTFLIKSLAVWRITSMLAREDCPYLLCERFRNKIGEVTYDEMSHPVYSNQLIAAFSCLWCLSVWVGLIAAKGNVKQALAYSAGAIMVDKFINNA